MTPTPSLPEFHRTANRSGLANVRMWIAVMLGSYVAVIVTWVVSALLY